MKKNNMLTYLERAIPKWMPDQECALDWDKKNHTIEIIMTLYAQNTEEVEITDIEGVAADNVIEFEDGFLLYFPEKSKIDPDDFLQTMPFIGKKGMPAYQLDAICDYLNDIMDEGESDLLDFINDPEKEDFELIWEEEKFAVKMAKHEKIGSKEWMPYPSY